jgi:putative phage-type endonuclease
VKVEHDASLGFQVSKYLKATGGRRGCPHPPHRMAVVPNSPASLILPECAGREPWLQARLGGIGGSEVGALVGISEYETPFSVWNTKKHGGKDLSGKAAVEWGHRLEEVVAQKIAENIGMVSRFAGGLWADRERPILRVTPDRFACRPRQWTAQALIECKTAGSDEEWADGEIFPDRDQDGVTTGSAPLSYQAQCQWQMGIIGLPVAYLGCLVLGSERQFFTVKIHFDAEWFKELADEAERFWVQNVLGDEPPMHSLRHPKTEALLKELHPNVVRPSVDLPGDADEWLADYRAAKAAVDAATTRLDEIKNYFRMEVGDAAAGYLGDQKVVSYPEVPSSRIDVTALKEQEPELAKRFTVTGHYRRMTIRPPK